MMGGAESVSGRASRSVYERRPGIRRRIDPWQLLVLPASAYLLVAFAAPLALMLAESFYADGGLSLENYARVLADSRGLQATANTIRYASWVTLGCILLGVPTAMAMTRASARTQMIVLIGMLLPITRHGRILALGVGGPVERLDAKKDNILQELRVGIPRFLETGE